jgi:hypothetical protein
MKRTDLIKHGLTALFASVALIALGETAQAADANKPTKAA